MILWPDREADGANETTTPSKIGTRDETGRLEKLIKKYDRGDLPKSDWLDTLVFRKMGEIHKVSAARSGRWIIADGPTRQRPRNRRTSFYTLTSRVSTFQSSSASR